MASNSLAPHEQREDIQLQILTGSPRPRTAASLPTPRSSSPNNVAMLNRKASRNALLAGTGNAQRRHGLASGSQSRFLPNGGRHQRFGLNPRDASSETTDDEESQSLLDGSPRDGRGALTGSAEQNGSYDDGWKASGDDAEVASLLEEGRILDDASIGKKGTASINSTSSRLSRAARKALGASRTVQFNATDKVKGRFPANLVRNQKYNLASFLPIVLYQQFKFFFNLYFLLVALSQFVPALRIGFLATYIAPLSFVLLITIGKEAYDDYQRYLRDVVANSTRYRVFDRTAMKLSSNSHHDATSALLHLPTKSVASSRLRVGDLVLIEKNQRVPADCVLLRTSDASGSCFVRTDQLDGETDWKLKVAVEHTQSLKDESLLMDLDAEVYADPPTKDIHTFIGTFTLRSPPGSGSATFDGSQSRVSGLTAENALWANTVLAAGQAVGFVIYTGRETRAVMNTSHPETKVGLLDLEINRLAKILCTVTFFLSLLLVALNGFRGTWWIYVFRFLILFSSIIPISLRVNLDMGKTVYARQIQNDPQIPGTIVRTSTLPEELGRIEYLLSDKTGTLTQNEMEMKKLHLGTISYAHDTMDEVATQLAAGLSQHDQESAEANNQGMKMLGGRSRRDLASRVRDLVLGLGLCHNVTPVLNDDGTTTYQASSPDEVAIVQYTESVGLRLSHRDRTRMELQTASGQKLSFEVLEIFPFTSETKRMGIVIRETETGDVLFYEKGADVVMARIVQKNDWLEEECGNMAREGLRTLVMARKRLTPEAWQRFQQQYQAAKVSLADRNEAMARVVETILERDLELLGVTGVEDKLQDDVRLTLELIRNAGIKIWMLTGDKIETATCIAISSKLVSRGQYIHQVAKLRSPAAARDELEFIQSKLDCCLVIDGESLQMCIDHFQSEFIEVATKLPAVVACRCSPTQKADIARLIRSHTRKRVCCIGDGGNDVSMIQAADVGLGIVGKEGKQASLAADFSINQFSYITKLLVWHGRNSYKRSAKLAQFVIHRGLIISIIQAVFSSVFYFAPIAIFQGWLLVGYSTIYTCLPVFSLVLDRDVNEDLALLYPELYKDLVKGRSLSYKTFFEWLMISVYQGGAIMMMSLFLFENEFLNIVAISFTALVLNELIMVALEISTWHLYMFLSEIITLAVYIVSMAFLPEYFNMSFVLSTRFIWKTALIVAVSSFPLYLITSVKHRLAPASYAKLRV